MIILKLHPTKKRRVWGMGKEDSSPSLLRQSHSGVGDLDRCHGRSYDYVASELWRIQWEDRGRSPHTRSNF